jgi:hypothetical protein
MVRSMANLRVCDERTNAIATRQELRHIASTNADQLMKAEETDARLSGGAQDVMQASMGSLEKLRKPRTG